MTDPATTTLAQKIGAQLGDKIVAVSEALGETTVEVLPENWLAVARALRDRDEFHFELLVDVSGVDYLSYGQVEWDTTDVSATGFSRGVEGEGPGRFQWSNRPLVGAGGHKRFVAVAHLLSIKNNQRVRIRCHAQDDALPVVPSLTDLWPGANWFEREAFDLFGIVFEGHPDLRRILTDYGFVGHPFRKDFPLIGNVEVRYDETLKRVIYEPVTSVEPRVLVPRTVRNDSRYDQAQAESALGKK
ncbi:MAG TPA: NADH-quinone oxidoreductase subunit C [Rudaea sp.]|jgi:NADH-quinone oxidoreductase subunit C|uniref:NADH-quinone oxidoreductase subunit C n=1 Tax=Rudaea sp. TaxID=2136325 RepID=UPI002F9521A8